ncbi:hypothetical protein [Paucibacter soli]|uniref:hypothetical protein n=1 Tax=Paucibacter soli TaxID=3133433 RepID=UPI0030A87BE7
MLISLVAPVFLLGLGLLPLIRWLHRGGRHRRTLPVSHLGLWRGATATQSMAGLRRPPDPAWRRRALLAALLCLALAEPQLTAPRTLLTLWVDDSISMLTREAQGSRLSEGLAQARAQLAELGAAADVEVRTLSQPWLKQDALTAASAAGIAAGAARQTPPAAPPAALLHGERQHWLLTDGANAALLDWPEGRRPDRIIQVGDVQRNVGLERLSARRRLQDPGSFDLLLKLSNGGNAAETRLLVIATEAGEAYRSTQHIDAGAAVLVHALIPAAAQVRATLQPGDALVEDDTLQLDLAALRRHRVATDPACPSALLAALATHPALALAAEDASDVEAQLDCGSRRANQGRATLRVLADSLPQRLPGALQWSPALAEARRRGFDIARPQLAARLQAQPADAVLLALGGSPLIIERAGASPLIETSLDFTAAARDPAIPLLVNLLFERLLGQRLLDATAVTERGANASRVVPAARASAAATAGAQLPSAARIEQELARPLLAIALLVLLWEIGALAQQWLRLREQPGRAGSA